MDPAKLKVVELRAQLSQRGLDTKGNKAVLVERLRKALEEEIERQPEERTTVDTEEAKDANDRATDSSKQVQPPKTPGRSSRSSSVATPTKISTRNSPKSLSGQLSNKLPLGKSIEKSDDAPSIAETEEILPIKRDQTTPPREPVTEMKECSIVVVDLEPCLAPKKSLDSNLAEKDEPTSEIEQTSTITPKKHDEDDKDQSADEQEDTCQMSVSITDKTSEKEESMSITSNDIEDDIEHVQSEEITEANENLLSDEESVIVKKDSVVCDKDNEALDKESGTIEKESAVHAEEDVLPVKESLPLDEESAPLDMKTKTASKADDAELNVENTEQDVEMECNVEKVESIDKVQEYAHIPSIGEQVNAASEENEETFHDEEKSVEEDINIANKQDDATVLGDTEDGEKTDKSDTVVETDQDVEMKVVIHDGDTKTELRDLEKKERKDRKRKRSPSPIEERQKSPPVVKPENEPTIDEYTMNLSWYDSDLNLVINKDGFCTATPMINDGFCYIWAGARGSYGVLHGKVYYEAKITENCPVNLQDEQNPHVLRVGWSVSQSSMQLGEDKLSYGYDSTGKKSFDNKFMDYGSQFAKDDIVGCYLDRTAENNITVTYTVNGVDMGAAFSISKEELGNRPLFPHILSRNCAFACNFGQDDPWSEQILDGYVSVGNVDMKERIPGPQRPERRDNCEVIMMCGLPAAGKTLWARNYVIQHPERVYNVLGMDMLIDKMKDMGISRKQLYQGRWEVLIDKCNRSLNKLIEMASVRRRNYILDQTNVYPSVQRRKMKTFYGYQRKAVIVVPTEEDYKARTIKHETVEGKEIPEATLMEMKANFSIPVVGEFFDTVEWVELTKDDAKTLIERYNKEGKEAGFAQQTNKRARYDRTESSRDTRDSTRNSRDSRDSRDHRDRRSNYSDRNRNTSWRGGNNMGVWRDRHRGAHMRHAGGYGPPGGWRGRGALVPQSHRGVDRRGVGGDRRSGNDRNRSGGSRQGGWNQMSNYQGQSQSWGGGGGQGSWSNQSQQQSGWGQGGGGGGGWGQQWGGGGGGGGNWKSYGQGSSYGQSSYNQQQNYGNGNWNSWNQQYYNEYWSQPQQTGQTTAAGGQAASTIESVTAASSTNSGTGYEYTQGWQGYTQGYTDSAQNASTNAQQCQQHK